MSQTKYVLETEPQSPSSLRCLRSGPEDGGARYWLEHKDDLVRIRRGSKIIWTSEASVLARVFAELLAKDKADCHAELNKICHGLVEVIDIEP